MVIDDDDGDDNDCGNDDGGGDNGSDYHGDAVVDGDGSNGDARGMMEVMS